MASSPANDFPLGRWLAEHRGILVKVARSFTRGDVESRELQQEMAYQLWLSLPRFAGQSKRSTWVYRVCLNTALTWRRGADRRERWTEPGANLEGIAAQSRSPAESAEQREWLEKLYAALQTLREGDRALVLLMLEGVAYREIAEVMGMTENGVGAALTRARQRLAAALKGVIDELG